MSWLLRKHDKIVTHFWLPLFLIIGCGCIIFSLTIAEKNIIFSYCFLGIGVFSLISIPVTYYSPR